MKKKELSKMVDEKLPELLSEKLPDLSLGEEDYKEISRLECELQEYSGRLFDVETKQNSIKDSLKTISFGVTFSTAMMILLAGLIIFVLWTKTAIMVTHKSATVIDHTGQVTEIGADRAIIIDPDGRIGTICSKVDFEEMLNEISSKKKPSVDYNYTYTADDDYSVDIYLKGGNSGLRGDVQLYRRPHSGVAMAHFSVVERVSDIEDKYLMNENYQYIESLETDDNGANKAIYRRANLDSFEPEPPVTEFIVLIAGDYSFLLSQEEYDTLKETIQLIS